jgi:hypothetical protein
MVPAPSIEESPVAFASPDLTLVGDLAWERLGKLPECLGDSPKISFFDKMQRLVATLV